MQRTGMPRVILVTRPSDLEELVRRHGTRDQARFFLQSREQGMEDMEERHRRFQAAVQGVLRSIPVKWRRASIDRTELAGFLFEPDDLVVVVGQDGLVANVAKYLQGQLVLGINPDPGRFPGILASHTPDACADLLADAVAGRVNVEARTMAVAELDDGQKVLALNEIFVGHRSHQSARYRIRVEQHEERHSSSGLIVTTGTGSTGWAQSIQRERRTRLKLPRPTSAELAFFVREAWPSRWTQTDLIEGTLREGTVLETTSEMNQDGVIFGDGIEDDRLEFAWGIRAVIRVAQQRLRLVVT